MARRCPQSSALTDRPGLLRSSAAPWRPPCFRLDRRRCRQLMWLVVDVLPSHNRGWSAFLEPVHLEFESPSQRLKFLLLVARIANATTRQRTLPDGATQKPRVFISRASTSMPRSVIEMVGGTAKPKHLFSGLEVSWATASFAATEVVMLHRCFIAARI